MPRRMNVGSASNSGAAAKQSLFGGTGTFEVKSEGLKTTQQKGTAGLIGGISGSDEDRWHSAAQSQVSL
jgi:hypothetical protein